MLTLGLVHLAIMQVHTTYWAAVTTPEFCWLGLAFVAMLQSALFTQEAPEHCFGAVFAYRTKSG